MFEDDLATAKGQDFALSLKEMHLQLEKMTEELCRTCGKPSVYYVRKAMDAIECLSRMVTDENGLEPRCFNCQIPDLSRPD